jgi:hypothetical protein
MAEATEHSRLQAIHPVVVSDFFDKLEALVKNRPAYLIWNVDETGTDLMNVQTGKVSLPNECTDDLMNALAPADANSPAPSCVVSLCRFWPRGDPRMW